MIVLSGGKIARARGLARLSTSLTRPNSRADSTLVPPPTWRSTVTPPARRITGIRYRDFGAYDP
jgi:hypothetical protein